MGTYSEPIIPRRSTIRKILKAIRIGNELLSLSSDEILPLKAIEGISLAGYIIEDIEEKHRVIHVEGYYKTNGTYVKPYTKKLKEGYYLNINKLLHDYEKEELIELFRKILKEL